MGGDPGKIALGAKSMVQDIFNEYARFAQIEAMAIGGSRALKKNDQYSNYDVYVYWKEPIPTALRKAVLQKHCSGMELGNYYREYTDSCIMEDGIQLNIIYRNLDEFLAGVQEVVEGHKARDGYTTCMWHSLLIGRIAYDKGGRLAAAKQRYVVRYPQALKQNVISHNMKLIKYGMGAYLVQINKAMKRGDLISINQEVHKFLASYFDVIFAMNEKLHPGEKRLLDICVKECRVLPDNFERNIRTLMQNMYQEPAAVSLVDTMVTELEKVLGEELG